MPTKIQKKIQVPLTMKGGRPTSCAEVDINTTKEDVAELMNKLIMDDDFRMEFNHNPGKPMRNIGINIDDRLVKRLGSTNIVDLLDSETKNELAGVGSVIILLILFPAPVMIP